LVDEENNSVFLESAITEDFFSKNYTISQDNDYFASKTCKEFHTPIQYYFTIPGELFTQPLTLNITHQLIDAEGAVIEGTKATGFIIFKYENGRSFFTDYSHFVLE
jgi:hypothetical protein